MLLARLEMTVEDAQVIPVLRLIGILLRRIARAREVNGVLAHVLPAAVAAVVEHRAKLSQLAVLRSPLSARPRTQNGSRLVGSGASSWLAPHRAGT